MNIKKIAEILVIAGMLAGTIGPVASAELESGFQNPPESAKPQTWWHWLGGNISKEGITADLEAMKRVGVGGAHIFSLKAPLDPGPIQFMSAEWFDLVTHATKEAERLGIELGMHNAPHCAGSGGPWIKPEDSMQMLVWSETRIKGVAHFDRVLAMPRANQNYYRDVAVLAFPTPGAERLSMAEAGAKITCVSAAEPMDASQLMSATGSQILILPTPKPGQQHTLDIEFPAPYTARSLTLAVSASGHLVRGEILASEDGSTFKTVAPLEICGPCDAVNFEPVSARFFRVKLGGGWLPLRGLELSGAERIEGMASKALFTHDQPHFKNLKTFGIESAVRRDRILDLSTQLDKEGKLSWDVPEGEWTILRVGHTTTGASNHTAGGLECDKLSRRGAEAHFAGYLANLLEKTRANGAKGITAITIDSWEIGSQNWTPEMRAEFQKRMGYDLLAYLPVLTGRPVESAETSERFLWDFRRTVADLLAENYTGRMAELAHQNGLQLSIEGYTGPFDSLAYAGNADIPMGEFWATTPREFPRWHWVKQMASAGHTYGKPIVAAESFTSNPGKWLNHPFRLKPLGDEIFTSGINRLVMHIFVHQPWLDRKPGLSQEYGIHFERTNTWWEQSRAWLTYLARCQYLLQQGKFVADFACLMPERTSDSYYWSPTPMHIQGLPSGYDYDALSPELLLRAKVVGGAVTLPSGMSYRVLVLPHAPRMRLAQLRKIRQLVEDGAIVYGPPPVSTPSLADGPEGDAEVRHLVGELWGDCDGVQIVEHRLGKGRVVWGAPVMELLWIPKDFSVLGTGGGDSNPVRFIHRRLDGKDVYFLVNTQSEAATFQCDFRVTGKRPELWHPDSGRIERVGIYQSDGGQTRVPIRLEPYGSVFVVFSDAKPVTDPVVSIRRDGTELVCPAKQKVISMEFRNTLDALTLSAQEDGYRLETTEPGQYELQSASGKKLSATVGELPEPVKLEGAWEVSFPKGGGAPEQVKFPKLISWPMHPDDGVKHFSGTATYRRAVKIPAQLLASGQRLYLDLGRVEVMAEVKLNGKDLGIVWKPPYRVDITEVAREGSNDLEVRVVNLWVNRLIGDERLPEDSERFGAKAWNAPAVKTWPQWLLEGKPSPTGRVTFSAWKHWKAEDPLLPSGLLGPVRLLPASVTTFTSK